VEGLIEQENRKESSAGVAIFGLCSTEVLRDV
jgi:hypothetical protein